MKILSYRHLELSYTKCIADLDLELETVKMAYDDHVYLAKLAEQAERYEGD